MRTLIAFFRKMAGVRVLRAAVSGAAGAIVQVLVFETLSIWLGLVRPSTAVVIGAELGILTNFSVANRYVFADAQAGGLLAKLVRFHVVVSGSLVIQWACVYAAESMTHDWLILHGAYAAGVLLGFVFNYAGYKLWVWRHPKQAKLPKEAAAGNTPYMH